MDIDFPLSLVYLYGASVGLHLGQLDFRFLFSRCEMSCIGNALLWYKGECSSASVLSLRSCHLTTFIVGHHQTSILVLSLIGTTFPSHAAGHSCHQVSTLGIEGEQQVGSIPTGTDSLPQGTQGHIMLKRAVYLGLVIHREGSAVEFLIIYIIVLCIIAPYEPLLGQFGMWMFGDTPVEHPAGVGSQFVEAAI